MWYYGEAMYLTTHAAVGVLISQSVKSPLWAFVLSFLSHFALDMIPHGDEDVGTWARKKPINALFIALIDVGLLTAMLGSLYAARDLPQMAIISAGVIGSVLPDFLSNIFPIIHHYTSWLFIVRLIHRLQYRLGLISIWRGHDWFHRLTHGTIRTHMRLRTGIMMQVAIVAVCLVVGLGLL